MQSSTLTPTPDPFEAALLGLRPALAGALTRRGIRGEGRDDLIQETLLRALRSRRTYDPARPLLPWLVVTALHLHQDARRREGLAARADLPIPPASRGPEELAILADESRRLEAALDALSDDEREILLLFHRQGLGIDECAARLGRNPATLRSLLHRARAALAARLKENRQ